MKVHKDIVEPVEKIASLGDMELSVISSNSLKLPNDPLFESYLKTIYLEKFKFYHLAFLVSEDAQGDFSKYTNLYPYLYPRYYSDTVNLCSKKHDVEEALIYALIREGSKFNKRLISKGTYFGLMQIDLNTAKKYSPGITPNELLDPSINICIGTKHLATLLIKYNYNPTLAIAAFYEGEEVINSWKKDKNGDIDVEQIPYLDAQTFIKHAISSYYKYKNLYNKD
jgi:soluble lytic murein transglycosylase